jgi:hypothetical protein
VSPPNALHFPTATRGSGGIQPFCSPNWYDHKGDSTLPETEEAPTYRHTQGSDLTGSNPRWYEFRLTFHVQKNQFCSASMLASVKSRTPCFNVAFHVDESIQSAQSPVVVPPLPVPRRNKPHGLKPLLNSPEMVTPNETWLPRKLVNVWFAPDETKHRTWHSRRDPSRMPAVHRCRQVRQTHHH